MDMGDQYGLPDLRRLLTRRTPFPASLPQPCEPYFGYRNNMAPSASNYHDQAAAYMMSNNGNSSVMPGGLLRFGTASASGDGGWSMGNIDGGNSRWPRQETLTLLEIRSRLDSKFKEANQKGPLWDEVSRIMADEYWYQRSGKKCREKFENLYKYYKKTKEGKAGRQDGKNYRFFKQLEAIYGETSNNQRISAPETTNIQLLLQENNQGPMQEHKISESLSFSGSEFEASSSENVDDHDEDELSAIAFMVNQKRVDHKNKGWKGKVKEFVDSQMKKLIDSQDVWMERMMKVIEEKEQERLLKEEEWRREEAARFDKEHEFWAKERAWIEARDASLMAALRKLTPAAAETQNEHENEIPALERRFQENINKYSKQRMWEEIEGKMVSLGYDHHQHEANDAECYKKRKEDYFQHINSINSPENKSVYSSVKGRVDQAAMDSSSSHSNSYDMNSFQLSGDQWDRYKGKNQQI